MTILLGISFFGRCLIRNLKKHFCGRGGGGGAVFARNSCFLWLNERNGKHVSLQQV